MGLASEQGGWERRPPGCGHLLIGWVAWGIAALLLFMLLLRTPLPAALLPLLCLVLPPAARLLPLQQACARGEQHCSPQQLRGCSFLLPSDSFAAPLQQEQVIHNSGDATAADRDALTAHCRSCLPSAAAAAALRRRRRGLLQQVPYAVALEGQVSVGGVHHKGQAALPAFSFQLGFAEAQQGADQGDRAVLCGPAGIAGAGGLSQRRCCSTARGRATGALGAAQGWHMRGLPAHLSAAPP